VIELEMKKSVIELELLLVVSSSFFTFVFFFGERSTFTAPILLAVPDSIRHKI
jgi:hypothetical protein